MYRIGEFSKMTRTTIKTLRYYDEAGKEICFAPGNTWVAIQPKDKAVRVTP